MKQPVSLFLACLLISGELVAQDGKDFNFEIVTLGGQKLDQSDFQHNVVIVDFWATWCPPCRDAIPGLVDLYKKYKHHGLEIIGLNYEKGANEKDNQATVREFAAEAGITYPLALGTKKIKNQIEGFEGYPTMLFFKRGMKYDHLEVGHSAKHLQDMETWVRKQLGLEDEASESEDSTENEDEKKKDKDTKTGRKDKIPDGVIYRPGNHDTGFEFEVKGVDGATVKFSDYRGKRVILVFTSTWDQEAVNTLEVLNELHATYTEKGVAIVAASIEIPKGWEQRVAAIETFAKKHSAKYPILPVGTRFLKKVYKPSGVPLFLVFDAKGTLILRRRNNTKDKILKAISQALK